MENESRNHVQNTTLQDRLQKLQADSYLGVGEDENGNILFQYLDLDGNALTYRKNDRQIPFVRRRLKNPGDMPKYLSGKNSGIKPYLNGLAEFGINQNQPLYLTEGEFKAHKLCQEGFNAIGLCGIHGLGKTMRDDEGERIGFQIMPELERFLTQHRFRKIVLLHDADAINKEDERRTVSFYSSVRNFYLAFKSHFSALYYMKISGKFADLAKGIDDLICLTGTQSPEYLHLIKPALTNPQENEYFDCFNLRDDFKGLKTFFFNKSIEMFLLDLADYRCNEVTGEIETRLDGSDEWIVLDDYQINTLLKKIRDSGAKCSKQRLIEIINSEFSPKFNPFINYFNNLPTENVEGYISKLAQSIGLKEKSQTMRFEKVLRMWLIAAVANATRQDLNQKTINELVLILTGAQGAGKTRWFASLIPESLQRYQYTGLVKADDKDGKAILVECFLVIMEELTTLRKNDIESFKAMVSESVVRYRRPYSSKAETFLRRASFCGSDNDNSLLSDHTGSRRFMIFETEEIDYQHGVNIDMVWAEANQAYLAGERYYLNDEEIQETNRINKNFEVTNSEDELINICFDTCDKHDPNGLKLQTVEIIGAINRYCAYHGYSIKLETKYYGSKKMGSALKSNGFVQVYPKDDNGKTYRAYLLKPKFDMKSGGPLEEFSQQVEEEVPF